MSIELYTVIGEIADHLEAQGVALGAAYKRRDRREPGRALKERDEDRLMRLVRRRFLAQKRKIKQALETILPPVKAISEPGPSDWMRSLPDGAFTDEESERALLKFFGEAAVRGVDVFQGEVAFDLDWELANAAAVSWARKYSTSWLAGLDKTTRTVLRRQLENFATQPKYTLGDVMAALPFDAKRAQRIAVTEITRVYAEATQIAGQELKKQFPDMRVVKRWFTNRDSLVCPICAPLHNLSVEIQDGFGVEPGEAGLMTPPAHPNCRCWLSTRTESVRPEATAVAPASFEYVPGEFVPAKTRDEVAERMRAFTDSYELGSAALEEQNMILQAVEETLGKYGVRNGRISAPRLSKHINGQALTDPPFDVHFNAFHIQNHFERAAEGRRLFSSKKGGMIFDIEQGLVSYPTAAAKRRALQHWKKVPRWSMTTDADQPLYATAVHEFWHVIDATNNWNLSIDLAIELQEAGLENLAADVISEYATTNQKEMFAEMATAYTTGVKFPPKLVKIFKKVLERSGLTP